MALEGTKSDVYIANGTPLTFTNEACGANGDFTRYTINDAAKRYWDAGTSPTIETSPDGVTWSPATDYTIEYVGGVVVFAAQQPAGTQIRASGKYLAVSQVGEANQWSLDINQELVKVPKFGDTWQRQIPVLLSASGKLSRWWMDNSFFDEVTNGVKVVLVLYTDVSTGSRYEMYANLSGKSTKVSEAEAETDDLSFQSVGPLYYRPL